MRIVRAAIALVVSVGLAVPAALSWLAPCPSWRERVLGRLRVTWARAMLRLMRIHVRVEPAGAEFPSPAIYAANHTGYLDILVLMSVVPGRFVAREGMGWWPGVGQLAVVAGTLFVNRRRPLSIGGFLERVRECLERGASIIFFPEATTSDGEGMLAFRSSLFAAATGRGEGREFEVRPVVICYQTVGGRRVDASNRDSVYWYGGMSLASHLWKVLCAPGMEVVARALPERLVGPERHEFARVLREEMLRELAALRWHSGGRGMKVRRYEGMKVRTYERAKVRRRQGGRAA